jgi:lipopolysaccharide transport system ATP-binding protein
MDDIAIKVDEIGKMYHIGHLRQRQDRLSELLGEAAKAPFRRVAKVLRGQAAGVSGLDEEIWALRGVSFQVNHGEVVGIIGRNGAGKSTLLKILSRITDLTEGYAEIHGRVGSLLEVGTGFHPDLTGRENIFLNGAILGMKRTEIARKFDEIVSFAETGKFLDTPVKHYSSGMYMRLAFAVAAHLEPDILIVDEVLSVGDAGFQRKCLGKMEDVAREGRTVLFVSHNMVAMQSLCDRVIWLDEGQIVSQGGAVRVVTDYLRTSSSVTVEKQWDDLATAPGNDRVRIRRACIRPRHGSPQDPIDVRTDFVIEFEYWNLQPGAFLNLSLHVLNEQGTVVFNVGPYANQQPSPAGLFRDVCHVPGDLMNDGRYRLELLLVQDQANIAYKYTDILSFDILDSPELRGAWHGEWPGAVRPILEWESECLETHELASK